MTDTDANAVQVSKSPAGINTNTINRPPQRNAIDGPTGRNLSWPLLSWTSRRILRKRSKVETSDQLAPSRMQIKKPIMSALAGYAVAGGLELSLLGDTRVAEEDVVFGAIMGLGRSLDMIVTGRGVTGSEALQLCANYKVVPMATSLTVRCLKYDRSSGNICCENCRAVDSAWDNQFISDEIDSWTTAEKGPSVLCFA
ncbi:hypothetical protein F5883DRAFT_605364 [Diaporthe sp. PMI_573]|nr:hypothetical protein F5883DRAFT_605364 [Diaporthaceae sp. PMI_573]